MALFSSLRIGIPLRGEELHWPHCFRLGNEIPCHFHCQILLTKRHCIAAVRLRAQTFHLAKIQLPARASLLRASPWRWKCGHRSIRRHCLRRCQLHHHFRGVGLRTKQMERVACVHACYQREPGEWPPLSSLSLRQ